MYVLPLYVRLVVATCIDVATRLMGLLYHSCRIVQHYPRILSGYTIHTKTGRKPAPPLSLSLVQDRELAFRVCAGESERDSE